MKVWDLHCDTLSELRDAARRGQPLCFERNGLHIDLEKLQKGDYFLQCFAAYVDLQRPDDDPLTAVLEMADLFRQLMQRYSDRIAPVYTAEDIDRNAAAGKLSALFTLEEGGCCKGSVGVLHSLYRLGARMMTLTWNYENELAWPNRMHEPGGPVPDTERGLKERGFEFVAEMERLHMLVDVSHLSDAGFWDVARAATRPFVASHSNARALCDFPRNLTDEMIRTMGEKGGLIGLNYCPAFVDPTPDESRCRSTVAGLARHARYITNLGGMQVLALGSDFDGIGGALEMENCSRLPLLAEALRAEGFSQSEAEAIFCGNARRFFKENL